MRVSRAHNLANSTMIRVTEIKISVVNEDVAVLAENPDINGEIDLTAWWQPHQQLTIDISFSVDQKRIREHCRLAEGDKLILASSAYCPGTKIQHETSVLHLRDAVVPTIQYTTSPYEAYKTLELKFSLAVNLDEHGTHNLGRPYLDYSRLWEEKHRLKLAGSFAQMNVVWHDFSNVLSAKNALWRIYFHNIQSTEIDLWPEMDASNVIEVQINEKYRVALEIDSIGVIALWSDLSREAIDLVMDLNQQDRDLAISLISSGVNGGSWIQWLRFRFNEAFNGLPSYMWAEDWRQKREEVVAQIQSEKASKISKYASSLKTGAVTQ